MREKSFLEEERLKYEPELPSFLKDVRKVSVKKDPNLFKDEAIQKLFPLTFGQPFLDFTFGESLKSDPLKVGVVLSGGQAPGGHNVIAGLFDAIKKLNERSTLLGFLNGPKGVIENSFKTISKELIDQYRNTGGFDLIGSGRDKIDEIEKLEKAKITALENDLDGLVIVGGDDSNTNAALLAEYFISQGVKTAVVGVPKTIDGDLKNIHIEISFGFDTASKTYSEIIGNILRDAISSKKYTHFIKLMGRTASHITLECALQTRPNLALIGEEIFEKRETLKQVVDRIANLVVERAETGKEYGAILIPEGLVEFIVEFKELIHALSKSSVNSSQQALFEFLPEKIQKQLMMDRDPHGNVQVSHIATDELLIDLVKKELKKRDFKGKFHPVSHFLGYEGRSGFPSNFDATYCYALGTLAACLIQGKHTGYMATLSHLEHPSFDWKGRGVPLTSMLHLEERKGKQVPVIKKAFVDLERDPFTLFSQLRNSWRLEDHYRFPGPLQYFGPPSLTQNITLTLELEKGILKK